MWQLIRLNKRNEDVTEFFLIYSHESYFEQSARFWAIFLLGFFLFLT